MDDLVKKGELSDADRIKVLDELENVAEVKLLRHEPKIIIGKYSKRSFDINNCGGEILNLNWKNIQITNEGINVVKMHISRFDDILANRKMINRLEKIINKEIKITDYDKRFYSHEIREFERYKKLGLENVSQKDIPNQVKVWNDTHTATLEDYKINEYNNDGVRNLYHPQVEDIDFFSDEERKLLEL
ncbi:hypothetical protein [Mesoflavibacter zeaxanthinifaciens]|uniref:hypothetical protein n=1 Tax=Mesoflavibacter zeaxanthinifaciens TaxID=393060 RepID=UPI003A8F1E65